MTIKWEHSTPSWEIKIETGPLGPELSPVSLPSPAAPGQEGAQREPNNSPPLHERALLLLSWPIFLSHCLLLTVALKWEGRASTQAVLASHICSKCKRKKEKKTISRICTPIYILSKHVFNKIKNKSHYMMNLCFTLPVRFLTYFIQGIKFPLPAGTFSEV